MIPAPFAYVRAGSVDEAVSALREFGDDARLVAGGHSLLPLMKLRLATPEVLVDLDRLDDLRGVRIDSPSDTSNPGTSAADGTLSIGALTTHQQIVDDPLISAHCGVLAEVAATIGDPQVRHRGTIGGALAHGDAAGDLPAVMLALDAVLVAQGPDGRREIPAHDHFLGYLTTALEPDEVLVEVRVPRLDGWRWRYEKFRPVAQAWAIVGALALVRTDGADVRVALTNMASVPVRAHAVEQHLRDAVGDGPLTDHLDAAAALAARGTDPPSDLHGNAAYREQLARVLTQRSLAACLTS